MSSQHRDHGNEHGNGHDHDEPQDSGHEPHPGAAPDEEPSYYAKRARAIEALLIEDGICRRGQESLSADGAGKPSGSFHGS